MTRTDVLHPSQLSESEVGAWRDLQRGQAHLATPFFAPSFTQAVGRHRRDARVAVVRQGREITGFFPFQAGRLGIGRPVGWKLNDFQGAVWRAGERLDAAQMLHDCQLRAWHFDHLPATQTWCNGRRAAAVSPLIDLTQGSAAYLSARQAAGAQRIKSVQRKRRKLISDLQDVRLEYHSTDPAVLHRLMELKRHQLRAAGRSNIFRQPWAAAVVHNLWQRKEEDCRPVLTALWSGDELLAAHLGLQYDCVLHWWITAYDPRFDRYSPGSVLLLWLLEAAAEQGVQRIDLGKGDEAYKLSFQSGSIPLYEGAATVSAWSAATAAVPYWFRQCIRHSCLHRPAIWLKAQWNGRLLAGF